MPTKKIESIPNQQFGRLQYRYYSFYLGHPLSTEKNWIRCEIKIPAENLKHAITLHILQTALIHLDHRRQGFRHTSLLLPGRGQVLMHYRKAIEYEKLYRPKLGYTVAQFRYVKYYSQLELADLFDFDDSSPLSHYHKQMDRKLRRRLLLRGSTRK